VTPGAVDLCVLLAFAGGLLIGMLAGTDGRR
jgi:hypothetical protein